MSQNDGQIAGDFDTGDRTTKDTDDLIRGLATQAGRRLPGRPGLSAALPVALVLASLASLAVVLIVAGARADLISIIPTWMFQFKVIGMVLIAAGALRSVWAASRPGMAVHAVLGLVPGLVFLAAGAIFDNSGFPLFGLRTFSVVSCAGTIIISSIPALAGVLIAMRGGTPTRLRRAGAVAGVLAGSIGALAYTVACLNDGAGFVALWYCAAIAIVAVVGAMVGPRALAW